MVQWFPSKFIILASISTLLKAVSGMVNGTVKANVNRHFSSAVKGKNLGDVTAKGQSQGVFAYVIGLFYGIGVTYVCHDSWILFLGNIIILNSLHLYSGYCSSKNLNSKHLNEQRGKIVTQLYLKKLIPLLNEEVNFDEKTTIEIPTPFDIAKKEYVFVKPKDNFPIEIGTPIDILLNSITLEDCIKKTIDSEQNLEKYLINLQDNKILISLHEKASEVDNFKAFFHSQVIRYHAKIHGNNLNWNDMKNIVDTYFPHFLKSIENAGWETNFILLYLPKHTPRFSYY